MCNINRLGNRNILPSEAQASVEPHEIAKFNPSFVSQDDSFTWLNLTVMEVLRSLWRGLKYEGFVIWPPLSQIIKYLVYDNASL